MADHRGSDIELLIQGLTLSVKISLLAGADFWHIVKFYQDKSVKSRKSFDQMCMKS